jgi:TonB family protein
MMPKIIFCCAVALLCCAAPAQQPQRPVGVQRLVAPEYPGVARSARIVGDVRMTIMVESSGKVASVTSASGPIALKDHAAENILRWSYTPFETRTELEVVYAYRLVGSDFEVETHPTVELETPFRIAITAHPVAITWQQQGADRGPR